MSALVYHERGCKICSEGVCSCNADVEVYERQPQENLEKARLLSQHFHSLAQLLEQWQESGEVESLVNGLQRLLDQVQGDIETLVKQDARLMASFKPK